ncbi:hypothetical protein ACWGIV_17060 [Streptomyces sp. NPDC054844]
MTSALPAKAAAFCREMAADELADLARRHGAEDLYGRAVAVLRAGHLTPELESDLDVLDALAERELSEGFYPAHVLAYQPLPGEQASTGAQRWACPTGQCAGRGRVRPGQGADPPVCAARQTPLVPRPLDA